MCRLSRGSTESLIAVLIVHRFPAPVRTFLFLAVAAGIVNKNGPARVPFARTTFILPGNAGNGVPTRRTETARRERKGEGAQRRERERKSERCGPRQRDIVQIAESGDIDHRGAAAAEPSGTDTSDLSIPLESLLSFCRHSFRLSHLHLLPFVLGEETRFLSARLLHIKNLFHSNRQIFFGIFWNYGESLRISINSPDVY